MTLQLDTRQRAMLKEMGVQVWLPGTVFAVHAPVPVTTPTPAAEAPSPAAVRPPPRQTPVAPAAPVAVPVVSPLAPSLEQSDAEPPTWHALVARVAACQACGLHAGRTECVLREDAPPVQADWLVLGAGTRGLPPELRETFAPAQQLRLPMLTGQRSLNLSNAVAVTVFEAWRQNGFAVPSAPL